MEAATGLRRGDHPVQGAGDFRPSVVAGQVFRRGAVQFGWESISEPECVFRMPEQEAVCPPIMGAGIDFSAFVAGHSLEVSGYGCKAMLFGDISQRLARRF
jgi:hypothetical protein